MGCRRLLLPAGRTLPVTCILAVSIASPVLAAAPFIGAGVARDEDPVILEGGLFSDFLGQPLSELGLFRYNSAVSRFEPIPFQTDERVNHVFNPGTPMEFTETIYDVYHEDDGRLDANDELAFLLADAGSQAPVAIPWPQNVAILRYEIEVLDPRPGSPSPCRWVYLFSGASLPRSGVTYVRWTPAPGGVIATDRFEIGFEDRWLLTEFRVLPPCGSGADLIDRAKGRATPWGPFEEDEEGWNRNSFFMGGIAGPIRAIRYVLGATSGVNTVHHDVVYRSFWVRAINLRVHPITSASLYLDWRPTPSGTRLFTPLCRSGVDVDGHPDTAISQDFVDWSVVRHPGGGMVTLYDVPASPLYAGKSFRYRDDATYDDRISTNPDYGDEDDAAYGDHGITVSGVLDCTFDPIRIEMRVYPICALIGDAFLGDSYEELSQYPLQTPVTPQWQAAGAVRTLQAVRAGADVLLSWTALAGATSYRVYASEFVDLPLTSWPLLAETPSPGFRDAGAAQNGVARFYSVRAVTPAGEGPW
jgi:hypothetical protein